MRNQWYGDNRDLVKWAVLLTLARNHAARRILQVAFLGPSSWAQIKLDGAEYPVPEAVIGHFRDVLRIRALSADPRIEVVDVPFVDRGDYVPAVLNAIAKRNKADACIVLVDPDTGLAPSNRANLKHVLDSELAEIWAHMPAGDVLVAYQHRTNLRGAPWIEPKRKQFERALGLPRGMAKVATASDIARDVAFFYCRK